MSKKERRYAQLPEGLKPSEVLARRGQPDYVERLLAQQYALSRIKMREEQEERRQDEEWAKVMPQAAQHSRYRRRPGSHTSFWGGLADED